MLKWRVGGRWYLALLIFPVLLLAVSLALSTWVAPELAPTLFAPGILMGLLAGSIEEIGWMGFAYPKMRDKVGIVRVSLVLGVLHALWHVLPDFLGRYQAFGVLWLPTIVGFCVHVVALRVLIVWVYENTESLLLAQLMHASSTGFFGVLIPIDVAPVHTATFYLVYGSVLAIAAAVIVVTHDGNLVRRPREAVSA
jgi:membrane protease YdiL (CAAX protease family)